MQGGSVGAQPPKVVFSVPGVSIRVQTERGMSNQSWPYLCLLYVADVADSCNLKFGPSKLINVYVLLTPDSSLMYAVLLDYCNYCSGVDFLL